MLPRPRTFFLLLGVLILIFGFQGLFNQTIDALDATPGDPRQNFLSAPLFDIPAPRFAPLPMMASLLAVALVVWCLEASSGWRWLRRLRIISVILLVLAALAWMPSVINNVAEFSAERWPAFLLVGFAMSLFVTLYNSEELTQQWLSVVTKASVLVSIVTALMFCFYCYAVSVKTRQEAEYERKLNEKDLADAAAMVSAYHEANPTGADAPRALKRFVLAADGLLQSNRSTSPRIARQLYGATTQLSRSSLLPEADRMEAMKVIFNQPIYRANKTRWEAAVKEFDAGLSFNGALERCLFGNEDLRLRPPYYAYLKAIRNDQSPLPANRTSARLDSGYRGTIDDLRLALRARSVEQLEALPPSIEIFYLDKKDEKKAQNLAKALRKRFGGKGGFELMVPQPELANVDPSAKVGCNQLAIFARGGSTYQRRLNSLMEFLTSPNPDFLDGKSPLPPLAEADLAAGVAKIAGMDHPTFLIYSEAQLKARSPGAARTPEQKLSDLSEEIGLFRESTRVNIFSDYGNPENHFEFWFMPTGR